MTDKELKKLSRLELLELLLIESHENQKLKHQLDRIQRDHAMALSVEQLNESSHQLQSALEQVLSLSDSLDKSLAQISESSNRAPSPAAPKEPEEPQPPAKAENIDAAIYKSIISFFIDTPDAIFIFPDHLRQALTNRLKEIREKQNHL